MPNRAAVIGDVVTYRNASGKTANVIVSGVQGAAPVAGDFTVTGAITGGTLAAATYSYKVAAVVDGVESPPSVAETDAVDSGSTGSVTIDFTAGLASFPSATAWKVYGRTDSNWLLIATVNAPTATYVDTGAVTPAGAVKAATSAVRFRDRGAKVTRVDIPMATTTKQAGAYFNR
jgi:hypothetical protein